jgi:hypothetical protein
MTNCKQSKIKRSDTNEACYKECKWLGLYFDLGVDEKGKRKIKKKGGFKTKVEAIKALRTEEDAI